MENINNSTKYKIIDRNPIKGDLIRNKKDPNWIAVYDHHTPIRHKGLHTKVGGFVYIKDANKCETYMSSTTIDEWEAVEEIQDDSVVFIKGDRIVCIANNLEGTFVMFDNDGYPILLDVSDNELPRSFRKEWWHKKVYDDIPYIYEEDTTKNYIAGKGQPAVKIYNTKNGRYPSLENSLLGLCPVCYLFSTKCTCGYNYGFKSKSEFQNALSKLNDIPYIPKTNPQIFFKFDEAKFRLYINKFLNEDKEKIFLILLDMIPAYRRNELIEQYKENKI